VEVSKDINMTKADKRLKQRFQEYWQYRINGDYKHSFAYELPYQQYITGLKQYKLISGGKYMADKIILYHIHHGKECTIVDRIVIMNHKKILKKDKWCFIKDNWYHRFYQSIFPPETAEEAKFQ
jgi:hypothetical protein